MTKTRFCPSPTGYLHLGNARTALFSALIAHHAKGKLLLRIEDTDQERSEKIYADALASDLKWLGVIWDEGAYAEGEHGPYWQSERADVYNQYYQKLLDQGDAFHCFCSEETLTQQRKLMLRQGKAPRYPGTCRHLTQEDVQQRIAAGETPTLRFKVPDDETITFQDVVRGELTFQTNDIGDFIIRRANGTSSFMFCNAVDDAVMKVTLAVRGEDHLTNTPRQLMILKALGLQAPQYGHSSLIVGFDGSPLSKRHGSKSLHELREEGYLPLALVNYLARLGHSYQGHDALMSVAECALHFSCDHLSKAPAKFDERQLLYWQNEAILALDENALADWLGKDILKRVPEEYKKLFLATIQPNISFPQEAADWATLFFEEHISYDDVAAEAIQAAGRDFFTHAIQALQNSVDDFSGLANALKESLGIKGKALFMPLRMALTGMHEGPEMKDIYQLLGKERCIARFTKALGMVDAV